MQFGHVAVNTAVGLGQILQNVKTFVKTALILQRNGNRICVGKLLSPFGAPGFKRFKTDCRRQNQSDGDNDEQPVFVPQAFKLFVFDVLFDFFQQGIVF